MIYAEARVTFRTPRLDDPIYDRLIQIPGAFPWEPYGRRTAWTVPYTAAWIAERVLVDYGVRYMVEVPHVDPVLDFSDAAAVDAAVAALQVRCLEAGVYSWVFDNFVQTFQMRCAVFAVNRRRANVWAEPGSGKTLIGVLAAAGLPSDLICVVTRSSVTAQYAAEVRRFTSWEVLERRPASRRRKSDEDLDEFVQRCKMQGKIGVVVVGWDMLVEWIDDLAGAFAGMTVIFDESQYARARKRKTWTVSKTGGLDSADIANTTAAAYRLAKAAGSVVSTTATSISNALIDLWGQMTLIEPDGWGITASRFAQRYCNATPNGWGGLDVKGMSEAALPELQARLAWSTIRIPYEVSHGSLPPKRRMMVRVALEDQVEEQTGHGKDIRAAQKRAEKGDEEAAATAGRLQLARAASRKRRVVADTVKSYLEAGKGKVILFSGWRKDCEYLGEQMRKTTDAQVWVSHGEDSKAEREALRHEFMAHPGPCVLVGTWQAWGTGLDLADADVIAFAMLPYTPLEVAQGEGRGDRISMNRPLLYLYFVADGTIDERVIDILTAKFAAVDAATPGSRLHAFGGIRDTLTGMDDYEKVAGAVARMLEKDDDLDAGWD